MDHVCMKHFALFVVFMSIFRCWHPFVSPVGGCLRWSLPFDARFILKWPLWPWYCPNADPTPQRQSQSRPGVSGTVSGQSRFKSLWLYASTDPLRYWPCRHITHVYNLIYPRLQKNVTWHACNQIGNWHGCFFPLQRSYILQIYHRNMRNSHFFIFTH